MKKIVKLSHRLLLLSVLTLGLGVLLFTDVGADKSRAALFCCYNDCIAQAKQEDCLDELGEPGPECSPFVQYCWRHCTFSCAR